jgi:hypothetical protein
MVRTSGMLEYFKIILSRVSFDALLFEKELRKALRTLIETEINQLRTWCYDTFTGKFDVILNKCFS